MPPKRSANSTTDPDVLLKRRQDRQKANEKLANLIEEKGIKRCEAENNLAFTSIPTILLINQKNYYTEYLKKDDNLTMVRNMKEKLNKLNNNMSIKSTSNNINNNNNNNNSATAAIIKDDNNGDINKNDFKLDTDSIDDIKEKPVDSELEENVRNSFEQEKEQQLEDDKEEETPRTLVIQPGSYNIKMGWADDVDPILIPNLIGYAKSNNNISEDGNGSGSGNGSGNNNNNNNRANDDVKGLDPARTIIEEEGENGEIEKFVLLKNDKLFINKKKSLVQSFKERMKYYKRRILPSFHESCSNFNHKQQNALPIIEDISEDINLSSSKYPNMFIKKDKWIKDEGRDYIIGEECLRLNNEDEWIIRSPFLFNNLTTKEDRGIESGFNEQDLSYSSREEILSDIELIFKHSFNKIFKINKENFKKINIVLIIPSLYRKNYVESMIELLLKRFNFQNLTFLQESLASSFGLGLSTGCIIDIGSTSIHISCIDDGLVIDESRITLNYGMNDIIRFWGKCLIEEQFPIKNINFNKLKDFKIIEDTFKELCTFDDSKLSIQVGNFSKFKNNHLIEKYQFKIFDQSIMCPMSIFYPENFIEEEGEEISDISNNNRIILGKIKGNDKKIFKTPLFEGFSNKFEGYENSEPISLIQELEIEGIKLSEIEINLLLELLVEINEFINNNNLNNGRKDNLKEIIKTFIKNLKNDEKFSKIFPKNVDNNNNNIDIDKLRYNMTPLDKAIIDSITIAGINDQNKMDKLYSNICIVGGGGNLEKFDLMLMDRINLIRNEILASSKLNSIINLIKEWKGKSRDKEKEKDKDKDKDKSEGESEGREMKEDKISKEQEEIINKIIFDNTSINVDITGKSDEINPIYISWKGGCVFARLKISEEMGVNKSDWDIIGSRSLTYSSLFPY